MSTNKKEELQEKITKMKVIRQKVLEGMEDNLNERYLYTLPYDQFYLTNSDKAEEVGFAKQDIYIAVKQLQDSEGKIKRMFELYDNDMNKFAETGEDGRLKYDREITDELVKMKQLLQKQNEEQGTNFKIAGLDKDGELEAYMQMMNREIISVTAEQKKEIEKKGKEPKDRGLDNKVDEKAKEAMDEKEQKTQEVAEDLGIDPQDIYQINQIKDDSFLRSEGITNGNELCAIKTRDGMLKMVSKNSEGKFEESPDFKNSSNEMGHTTYATNEHNNLQETNTYGAIYFANDANKRLSARMGQYGELEIIKQERVTSNLSGKTMSNDETWSPGVLVQSDNTATSDLDLGGRYSTNKVVFNKIDRDNIRMNEESATIRTHGGENLKVKDIANDSTRGIAAFERVRVELNNRGVELTSQEEEELQQKFEQKGVTFCKEEVDNFCDKYEKYKENKDQKEENKEQKKEKEGDKEQQENDKKQNDEQEQENEERTLAGDALQRRGRR